MDISENEHFDRCHRGEDSQILLGTLLVLDVRTSNIQPPVYNKTKLKANINDFVKEITLKLQ